MNFTSEKLLNGGYKPVTESLSRARGTLHFCAKSLGHGTTRLQPSDLNCSSGTHSKHLASQAMQHSGVLNL